MSELVVFAPASIGNMIVGFDCLGAAVQPLDDHVFGDRVRIAPASCDTVEVTGPYAAALPQDPNENIVVACRERFRDLLKQRGVVLQPHRMVLEKLLPIGSGLGSSAASVVASLVALNQLQGKPLADDELLRLCGEMEGRVSGGMHLDNVAPSLRGGLQLMVPDEHRLARALPVPDWYLVLCHPGIQVETKRARAVLPQQVPLAQAVHFAGRLAAFVAALCERDFEAALDLLGDDMIEPHRIPLVPGFEEAKRVAYQAGARAFGLSGSGPTCLAVCTDVSIAEIVARAIPSAFPQHSGLFCRIARIAEQGAQVVCAKE